VTGFFNSQSTNRGSGLGGVGEIMSNTAEPLQFLETLSNATVDVVKKVSPAVVSVRSGRMHRGTGVVWTQDGYIVTCNHVLGRRSATKVQLEDGRKYDAQVVGRDPYSDIALLKIDEKKLVPIEQGDSDALNVGQFVVSLAKPFDRPASATWGMITSVGVSLRSWRGMTAGEVIVTDARLVPGYSGGPMVDVSGKLVGLNTAYVGSRGLAIPLSTIKKVASVLSRNGGIKRAFLGVTQSTISIPAEVSKKLGLSQNQGVIVLSVEPDSPARNAGLALGDIIVKFGDKPVKSVYDIPGLLTSEMIGKETELWILRGEEMKKLTITPIEKR
jgi:S1-C subfamily serine protease